MTNVIWGNQVATDDIQDGDQILTLDNSSGNDVAKPRTMAQVAAYAGAGGATASDEINPDLLYRTSLGTATFTIASRTDMFVDNGFLAPESSRGARIELSVGTIGTGAIDYSAWNALTAIDAQSLPAGGLVEANSVSVTIGGVIFRVGKAVNVTGSQDSAHEYFAFAAGANGAYAIAVSYLQLALESWADRNSPTEQIPANRLLNAPAGGGGGGGLNAAQVDARIADWAETTNTDPIPASKLTNSPSGATGPRGPAGPQGPAGASGATGARGPAGQGVPAGGTDGQVLTKTSSANYATAWETPTAGGGGLDQAAVDARIDNAIPPAQRVPSFAAGDAGEVVKVNPTGTALIIAPETPGSGGGSNELNALASFPAIANHQVGDIINLSGVLYELVASSEDQNVYRGAIAQVRSGFLGDNTFEYQTVSPFNRRLYVPNTAPGFSSPPTTIYTLVQTPSPHGLYSTLAWGRASADDNAAGHPNTYAYHKIPGDPTIDALPIGTPFSLSFYSDEARKTALNFHSANRWERDDRNEANVNPIALAGNTDRWDYPKLPSDVAKATDIPHIVQTHLYDEAFPGLSITSGDTDRRPAAPTFPTGTIDLDDNPHGEFHVSLELNITASSDVNLSFHRNTANATPEQRQVNHSANIFASDIAEEDAFVFSATAALSGVTAVTQNIYSANTTVGTYYLLLVRNAQNQVGFYHHYDGQAGSANITIAAELRVSFTPSDAPASGGGGGGGITFGTALTWAGTTQISGGTDLNTGITRPTSGRYLLKIGLSRHASRLDMWTPEMIIDAADFSAGDGIVFPIDHTQASQQTGLARVYNQSGVLHIIFTRLTSSIAAAFYVKQVVLTPMS